MEFSIIRQCPVITVCDFETTDDNSMDLIESINLIVAGNHAKWGIVKSLQWFACQTSTDKYI